MDLFDEKNIAPMLIGDNQPPFDSADYFYELKLDGIRCIAYLDENNTVLRNKRNKDVTAIYPELSGIHKQVGKRCILDGEVFVMKDGRPNFYELQKRSLMTNPFKIKMASDKLPVCFTTYDILYIGNEQITSKPLSERKELLSDNVFENTFITVSRVMENNGIAFFNLTKEQGLEGIVAKRKDSKYYLGKTTKDWVKMKALLDDDFVVCGYYQKSDKVTSIILGQYVDDKLTYKSHVVLGVSREDFKIILNMESAAKDFYPNFPDFKEAIWIKPELVCVVEFMERTRSGGLRQPVFKGLRDDKAPKECVAPK